METTLKIENLSKSYGTFPAVKNLSLEVKSGEIYAFLGPNGAGKTTTLKMISGQILPDSGSIWISGSSISSKPEKAKRHFGYIPDRPFLYERLTAYEYAEFIAGVYNLPKKIWNDRWQYFVQLFGLYDWQNVLLDAYSHGMRQKILIICSFLHEPPLIIVDEPMVGLDPLSARKVKDLFIEYADKGNSIFMSTHSMDIAESISDRIGIIHQGRLLIEGSLEELKKAAKGDMENLEEVFLKLTEEETELNNEDKINQ